MDQEKIITTKSVAPPPDLPIYGQIRPSDICFFGRTNYESEFEAKKFIFGIKRNDRRRHFYIIGKADAGKTKLIEILCRQDISYDHGLALFDSDGDVIEDILNFIPEKRIEDVVLIDPTDNRCPIIFNPLKNLSAETKHHLSQAFIEIIKKNFNTHWDPQIEHLLRFSFAALLNYPQAALAQLVPFLTDENFRGKVLEHNEDKMIKNFWEKDFPSWPKELGNKTIAPLVNKLIHLLHNPYLLKIFETEENKIDFEAIVSEKKILLVNLAKSKLGNEAAGFFGSLILAKIHEAALAHGPLDQQDFYVYLDEFQILNDKIVLNFLEHSKRGNFSFILSHQHRGQVESAALTNILSNIATMTVFRISSDDAAVLEKEMAPVFKAKDMINLGSREFYIKMAIDGNISDPFSAETLRVLPPPYESNKEKILENNCREYGKMIT